MYQDLIDKEKKLAVIGLGYVGLPIALEFAEHLSVIGFDISEERLIFTSVSNVRIHSESVVNPFAI